MNDYNLVKLTPYLARSKNLIDFFGIIGYSEKLLNELSPNISDNKKYLEVSLINGIFPDNSNAVFDAGQIMKKVYLIREIKKIYYQNQEQPQKDQIYFLYTYLTNSLDKNKKILYYCYIAKFYEIYQTSISSYFIPKAYVIYSQYPYFYLFAKILLYLLKYKKNNNNDIPLEAIVNCLLNYTPSPLNYKLNLNIFPEHKEICIPRLPGYAYANFDIYEKIKNMSINDLIITYVFTFLEIELLFFSSDIVKLNETIFAFQSLNYPLIDSKEYWYISIFTNIEKQKEQEMINTTFRGVIMDYNSKLKLTNFKDLFYIVDVEKGELKCARKENNNSKYKEINKLYMYFQNILKNRNVNSLFLRNYLLSLKRKVEFVKNQNLQNPEIRNLNIQNAFYLFVLNILSVGYKDYQINEEKMDIIKRIYNDPKLSEEEKIFLRYFRQVKYSFYFEKFIQSFKAPEELKTSYFLTDLFTSLKMKNPEESEKINFFNIIKEIYSNNEEIKFDFKDLNNEYQKIIGKNQKKNTTNQLATLDKNVMNKYFFYHKNGKSLFSKIKEKMEKFTKNKIYIISATEIMALNNSSIVKPENILYNGIIYIFAIVFPLFHHENIQNFLNQILNDFNKIIFQKHFIFILLNSIYNYYIVNNNGQFPELSFQNIKNYFTSIKNFICNNKILPDESISVFLKKVFSENNNNNIINNNNINENIIDDKPNFIFKYNKEEDYENNVNNINIERKNSENILIFNYKGQTEKYNLFLEYWTFYGQILFTYENFSKFNYDIKKYDKIDDVIEIIANIIYFLKVKKNTNMIGYLLNAIISLNKLKSDLSEFNQNNIKNEDENKNQNNIDNRNNNNNNNIIINDQDNIIINNENNNNNN